MADRQQLGAMAYVSAEDAAIAVEALIAFGQEEFVMAGPELAEAIDLADDTVDLADDTFDLADDTVDAAELAEIVQHAEIVVSGSASVQDAAMAVEALLFMREAVGPAELAEAVEGAEFVEVVEAVEGAEFDEVAETVEGAEFVEVAEAVVEGAEFVEVVEAAEEAEFVEVVEAAEDAEFAEVAEAAEDAYPAEVAEAAEDAYAVEVAEAAEAMEFAAAVEVSGPVEVANTMEAFEVEEAVEAQESSDGESFPDDLSEGQDENDWFMQLEAAEAAEDYTSDTSMDNNDGSDSDGESVDYSTESGILNWSSMIIREKHNYHRVGPNLSLHRPRATFYVLGFCNAIAVGNMASDVFDEGFSDVWRLVHWTMNEADVTNMEDQMLRWRAFLVDVRPQPGDCVLIDVMSKCSWKRATNANGERRNWVARPSDRGVQATLRGIRELVNVIHDQVRVVVLGPTPKYINGKCCTDSLHMPDYVSPAWGMNCINRLDRLATLMRIQLAYSENTAVLGPTQFSGLKYSQRADIYRFFTRMVAPDNRHLKNTLVALLLHICCDLDLNDLLEPLLPPGELPSYEEHPSEEEQSPEEEDPNNNYLIMMRLD